MNKHSYGSYPSLVNVRYVAKNSSSAIESAFISLCLLNANNIEKSFGVWTTTQTSKAHTAYKRGSNRKRATTNQKLIARFSMTADVPCVDSSRVLYNSQVAACVVHYETAYAEASKLRETAHVLHMRLKPF